VALRLALIGNLMRTTLNCGPSNNLRLQLPGLPLAALHTKKLRQPNPSALSRLTVPGRVPPQCCAHKPTYYFLLGV
jgi:hypothetical protein